MIGLRRTLEILSSHRTNEFVLVPFTGSVLWEELSRRPELDLPYWGSMGKAASTGLGLALAMPDLRVWVLDGDGSLLMNLGCLVTTAHQAPPNLVHVVLENGIYATTGGQPIPGQGTISFATFARGAGFPEVYEYQDETVFRRTIGDVLRKPGPVFVDIKVSMDPLPRKLPRRRTKEALREATAALERLREKADAR